MAVDGEAQVDVRLHPAAGFGAQPLRDAHRDGSGRWTGRTGNLHLRWTGAPDARADGPGQAALRTAVRLEPGAHHDLVLEVSDRPLPAPEPAGRLWRATEDSWAACVPGLPHVLGSRDARHAVAVLRGLTTSGGGAVAAATTSLPERAEQGRNYDYRYVWIRDQCFIGQAAALAGVHPLLDDSVRFVTARLLADGPALAPAYTAAGAAVPDLRTLDLPGYPGGFDVVGNHVNRQFQLDALGECLLLFAAAARRDRLGPTDGRPPSWRRTPLPSAATIPTRASGNSTTTGGPTAG
ncbi:glycoside hydrolase family 15 protein [Kitasatospora sp. KL5]|uniref:glycoside hydrolase family 15 protein n=1 Tax=Kitasatospora sp. KL5 TaxID=3425125 RepID=UPI003D6F784D